MIGKINRVPLREVWKNEARDFTTWLEENIDILNEPLDFNLSSAEREKEAGKFSVDLVAEDDKGNLVVIENQLERSNHDHLGKLITYLTTLGAKKAVWIVSDPRPEHVNAISWLNESSSASFYLLKVEAVSIGGSDPAPLFTLIVGPSEEAIIAGERKKEIAERHILRERFWTQLLDYAKTKTKLHANIAPNPYNWLGTSSGKRGLGLNYGITQHETQVELYIDRGKEFEQQNEEIFNELVERKEKIEEVFGEPLNWQRLEEKRACRIKKKISLGGWKDEEEKWPSAQEATVDAMIRLENALRPYIQKLNM